MAKYDNIAAVEQAAQSFEIKDKASLENFRISFLKKEIPALMGHIKNIDPKERRDYGMAVNQLKQLAEEKFQKAQEAIQKAEESAEYANKDLTLPSIPQQLGALHPLRHIQNRISEIFMRIGFNISEGPEIEDDWHNFTALNFPPNHPAREMQDTFFVEKNPDIALRTHTSSVQIRVMENEKPPIRTLSPGRVFRNEAISARAHCVFHQVEGLYINENVSFAELKQTLYHFVKEMFGKDTKIRFRPSYFPFTEPSAEVDISCNICKGEGCNVCKYTGWVEIMGCGMVDPNVLDNCNIDPEKYTGFAFGMGIERIAMLKYQINDLRLYTENDLRFLQQFANL